MLQYRLRKKKRIIVYRRIGKKIYNSFNDSEKEILKKYKK